MKVAQLREIIKDIDGNVEIYNGTDKLTADYVLFTNNKSLPRYDDNKSVLWTDAPHNEVTAIRI